MDTTDKLAGLLARLLIVLHARGVLAHQEISGIVHGEPGRDIDPDGLTNAIAEKLRAGIT